jgi:hypothetical protein
MSPELEQKLVEKYPSLFGDRTKPPTESLMCYGCEHDDGWYDIIDSMCSLIKRHLEGLETDHQYRFTQIKEKFGGLRVYDNWSDDYIRGVIDMAESMSYRTCEVTGKPGELCNNGFWVKTLSPAKMEELGYTKRGDET